MKNIFKTILIAWFIMSLPLKNLANQHSENIFKNLKKNEKNYQLTEINKEKIISFCFNYNNKNKTINKKSYLLKPLDWISLKEIKEMFKSLKENGNKEKYEDLIIWKYKDIVINFLLEDLNYGKSEWNKISEKNTFMKINGVDLEERYDLIEKLKENKWKWMLINFIKVWWNRLENEISIQIEYKFIKLGYDMEKREDIVEISENDFIFSETVFRRKWKKFYELNSKRKWKRLKK